MCHDPALALGLSPSPLSALTDINGFRCTAPSRIERHSPADTWSCELVSNHRGFVAAAPPRIFSAVDQLIVTEVNESQSATIRFAVGECSLGSILVAASEKGVCAIFLGDNPDALVKDLQDRFPKARLIGDENEVRRGDGNTKTGGCRRANN